MYTLLSNKNYFTFPWGGEQLLFAEDTEVNKIDQRRNVIVGQKQDKVNNWYTHPKINEKSEFQKLGKLANISEEMTTGYYGNSQQILGRGKRKMVTVLIGGSCGQSGKGVMSPQLSHCNTRDSQSSAVLHSSFLSSKVFPLCMVMTEHLVLFCCPNTLFLFC